MKSKLLAFGVLVVVASSVSYGMYAVVTVVKAVRAMQEQQQRVYEWEDATRPINLWKA